MKRLTDPDFRYVSAAATNIRKTFERIRREQRANDQERREKLRSIQTKRTA